MSQQNLFDGPPQTTLRDILDAMRPPSNGTPTSNAAAEGIIGATRRQQQEILDLLKAHPKGLTDEEIQDKLGMNPSSERPRRGELVAMNKIQAVATRPTRSGRRATVWILV